MDIPILVVRGFIKIISKCGKKLCRSGAASTTFYFKVGKSYFKVGQLLQIGAECYIKMGGNYLKLGHNSDTLYSVRHI